MSTKTIIAFLAGVVAGGLAVAFTGKPAIGKLKATAVQDAIKAAA